MKSIIKVLSIMLLTITTLAPSYSFAWTQRPNLPVEQCKVHSPWGFASSAKSYKALCRQGYLSAYDTDAKIPGYVAYSLTPTNALGCWPRTNAFVADAAIQNGAKPGDYAGTGYDRGHAAPDGDQSWDEQVEYESFLMTNMYPQLGGLNRGIWKLLETSIRGWSVQQNSAYTIYVGAIYDNTDKKIGNGIVVPHGFYKIVVNQKTGAAAGWLFPHAGNQGNDLTKVRAPIAKIQQLAGVKFAYPTNISELPAGKEWPIDYGALTNAKRAKCGTSH